MQVKSLVPVPAAGGFGSLQSTSHSLRTAHFFRFLYTQNSFVFSCVAEILGVAFARLLTFPVPVHLVAPFLPFLVSSVGTIFCCILLF